MNAFIAHLKAQGFALARGEEHLLIYRPDLEERTLPLVRLGKARVRLELRGQSWMERLCFHFFEDWEVEVRRFLATTPLHDPEGHLDRIRTCLAAYPEPQRHFALLVAWAHAVHALGQNQDHAALDYAWRARCALEGRFDLPHPAVGQAHPYLAELAPRINTAVLTAFKLVLEGEALTEEEIREKLAAPSVPLGPLLEHLPPLKPVARVERVAELETDLEVVAWTLEE
ncbi:hypothetical protein [Marinithermus hydrothermalis]|uniref:Uncharacterized protein n=1 Tax=Marinithermus hydrothermalis (strain DSM 14884 / JCM 11576 / T1) TaxID=869210 RepID=F2NKD4_MARHT|nr:hypothetical protein [Marinithermus hydrothermalis]AEB12383.1 hypothetical protein Marky_1648 [Marinithermus hydrothermalis DSM 14884]